MRTDIDFLLELEEDLRAAADHRAPARTPVVRLPGAIGRARRLGTGLSRRVRIAAAVAAVMVVAAVLGSYALRRNDVTQDGLQLRAEDLDAGGVSSRAPGRRSVTASGQPESPVLAPVQAGLLGRSVRYNAFVVDADGRAGGGEDFAGLGVPIAGPRVVKTASLGVVVQRGGFQQAFQEAALVATRYGGYVESSETNGSDSRRGHLVIRVPVERFEAAVADMQRLGKLESEATAGEDVTARYVDLQARLRAWVAEEHALVGLLSKATTVDAALRVRRELQAVRQQIERLQGQIRVLDDATDLGTISVSLREKGVLAAPVAPAETGPNAHDALKATRDAFLGVVFGMLVGLGYLVPVLAALALAWLVWRRARRPVARPAD